jgi:hypothetical protein
MVIDNKDNVWVGTDGGGLKYITGRQIKPIIIIPALEAEVSFLIK